MTKQNRVKYNFNMNMPTGKFTINDLMTANPGVLYITLYMKMKKMIKDETLKAVGLETNAEKRGRSRKVYEVCVKRKHTKKVLQTA